jgi:hypothetical protein
VRALLVRAAAVVLAAGCSGDNALVAASSVGAPPPTTTAPAPPPSTVVTTTIPTTTTTIPPSTAVPAPPPSPHTFCTSVVHIGDSTSVGMISPSYLAEPAQRLEAQYARVGVVHADLEISGARSIVETLRGQVNAYDTAVRLRDSGYHGCWVFALGTTDTANVAVGSNVGRSERIRRMMSVTGDDPVLWVDVRTLKTSGAWSDANMQLWNQALQEALPLWPSLRVYDWASAAQDGWFAADRIHYTSAGYAARAAMIADALAAAFPP